MNVWRLDSLVTKLALVSPVLSLEPGRSALVQFDVNVADALSDASRTPLSAWPPTAKILVAGLVDRSLADEQGIGVDIGTLEAGIGDGAGDELLHERRTGLEREIEKLQRVGGVSPADQIDDHPRFTRTNPLKIGFGVAYHDDSFLVRPVDPANSRKAAALNNHLRVAAVFDDICCLSGKKGRTASRLGRLAKPKTQLPGRAPQRGAPD